MTTKRAGVWMAAALFLGACGGEDAAPAAPPPPEVGVAVMQPALVPVEKDLVGRLAPFRSADVRARVPGVLQQRVYEEGTDVRAGQVLFRIDPAQLQAAVGQAQAALAAAQASYTNAKVAADRARQLAPQKFVSRSDLDNAEAAERSAAAAVKQAQSALANARINLGYATVRSPIDGRAGKQQVTEGALVGEGTPTLLTTVDQIDPLYVNFSLSVAEREQLRALGAAGGDDVRVRVLLPDGSEYAHEGTLDFSGDIVDPATGAIALRARIPNPRRVLLPGTYVTLKARLGEQAGAYLVPKAALQRDAKGAYVLAVGADGKVVRKDVAADRAQGSHWVVSKGLQPGDRVITSGLQRVQPGQPAKAVPDASPVNGAKPPAASPGKQG